MSSIVPVHRTFAMLAYPRANAPYTSDAEVYPTRRITQASALSVR
jgi:hypothetical protein